VDPRAPGGGIASSAQVWPQVIVLNSTTVARARVQNGTNWSGLAEAAFYTPQDFGALALTEIMYHPPEANSAAFELVALNNTGTNTLNMTGVSFTHGLAFTFTNNTLLGPGQFFVLAADADAFAAKYPNVELNGLVSSGHLDNNGETLTLSTALGTPILSLTY